LVRRRVSRRRAVELIGEHRDLSVEVPGVAGTFADRGVTLGQRRLDFTDDGSRVVLPGVQRGAERGELIVLSRRRAQHHGVVLIRDAAGSEAHEGLSVPNFHDGALAGFSETAILVNESEPGPALGALDLTEIDDDAFGTDREDHAFLDSRGRRASEEETDRGDSGQRR
jgi:hypothetical protein